MEKEKDKKCIACSIVNGELIPMGGIIYETENFILAQDAEVPISGFLVIQTRKHLNSVINLSKKEREELMELVYETRAVLEKLNICKEIRIVQEERSKHFHVWLFPYHEWMKEKFGKGIQYLRDINKYVIQNATQKDIEEVISTNEKIKRYFREKVIE